MLVPANEYDEISCQLILQIRLNLLVMDMIQSIDGHPMAPALAMDVVDNLPKPIINDLQKEDKTLKKANNECQLTNKLPLSVVYSP